jgi:hypothetical protein
MSLLRDGAQWASPRDESGSSPAHRPRPSTAAPAQPLRRGRITRVTLVIVAVAALLPVSFLASAPAAAADDYLLMPRAELLALPTSGSGWAELKEVADSSLGTPNLCDQESPHHLRTLAKALVYARTGSSSYGGDARYGIMEAIKTQRVGCDNATLALGRQLMAYVLAADFANLSGSADSTFRSWLSAIRTKDIGGHSKWWSLTETHRESANNWGGHAGASRIAASLYLGDDADVASASKVTRGFLGDRSAYAGFGHTLDSADLSWTCSGSASSYTPVNPTCERGGVQVGGAAVLDISRGGSRTWPPDDPGIPYQLETIQGVGMQVELLYRNGYPSAWGWSSNALKRMADVITRSKAAGGTGWNETKPSRQMPWLLNRRYGTSYPRVWNGTGRLIGFTSWLYGTSTPLSDPPTVGVSDVRPSVSTDVPTSGIKTVVQWKLLTKGTGLKRFELQMSRDGGSWSSLSLTKATSTLHSVLLGGGHEYAFRVRAVDTANRAGPWVTTRPRLSSRITDASGELDWSGSWSTADHSGYLGGEVRSTDQAGATVRFEFTGNRLAWIAPVGPTRGKARVYVDGDEVAVVDQYASSFVARRVVLTLALSDGRHDVEIKALGTSGRPTVAIDAIDLLDPR